MAALLPALAVIGGLAGAAVPQAAQAQNTLVSNIDESGYLLFNLNARLVTGFTTGSSAAFVTSVTLPIEKTGGSRGLSVSITSSRNGNPYQTVLSFTSPSSIRNGNNTFTVASGEDPVLDANTDYFIHVTQSGGSGDTLRWAHTQSDGQVGESGWSIANTGRYLPGSWVDLSESRSGKFHLEGGSSVVVEEVSIVSSPRGAFYKPGETIELDVAFTAPVRFKDAATSQDGAISLLLSASVPRRSAR